LRTFGSDLQDVVKELQNHPEGIKITHWARYVGNQLSYKEKIKTHEETFSIFLESEEHFAIQDDWNRWNKDGERGRSGKPFQFDLSGEYKQVRNLSLFFDDNITGEELDIILPVEIAGKEVTVKELLEVLLFTVNTKDAILDDDYFFTAADNKVKFWDNRNLSNFIYCFNGHEDSVIGLELLNNNNMLSYSIDGKILNWSIADGNIAFNIEVDYPVTRVAVSHKLWIQGIDFIEVYNLDGTVKSRIEVSENGKVKSMITKNNYLITGSTDRIIKVWNDSGDQIHSFSGHQDEVTSIASFKNWVYSSSHDCTLKQWYYDFSN